MTLVKRRHDRPEAAIAQLGERQTEDLKVPGSIPGLGMSTLGPEDWCGADVCVEAGATPATARA